VPAPSMRDTALKTVEQAGALRRVVDRTNQTDTGEQNSSANVAHEEADTIAHQIALAPHRRARPGDSARSI
jgi:hypothetical protein